MENTETINKVPISAKVDPLLREVVENIARDDDRSISNVIERILKTNPEVQKQMKLVETA